MSEDNAALIAELNRRLDAALRAGQSKKALNIASLLLEENCDDYTASLRGAIAAAQIGNWMGVVEWAAQPCSNSYQDIQEGNFTGEELSRVVLTHIELRALLIRGGAETSRTPLQLTKSVATLELWELGKRIDVWKVEGLLTPDDMLYHLRSVEAHFGLV